MKRLRNLFSSRKRILLKRADDTGELERAEFERLVRRLEERAYLVQRLHNLRRHPRG